MRILGRALVAVVVFIITSVVLVAYLDLVIADSSSNGAALRGGLALAVSAAATWAFLSAGRADAGGSPRTLDATLEKAAFDASKAGPLGNDESRSESADPDNLRGALPASVGRRQDLGELQELEATSSFAPDSDDL